MKYETNETKNFLYNIHFNFLFFTCTCRSWTIKMIIHEPKRFVIELFTNVSIEDWHRNNELLKKLKGITHESE